MMIGVVYLVQKSAVGPQQAFVQGSPPSVVLPPNPVPPAPPLVPATAPYTPFNMSDDGTGVRAASRPI